MILGPISFLDCFAFLVFLAPQLLIQVGPYESAKCVFQVLPFLILTMPRQFIHDQFFTTKSKRPPFVQVASIFADIVIRCVRYAFAYIPASIGAVFFSKPVSLPFARFRMLRHGYFQSPIHYEEIVTQSTSTTSNQSSPDKGVKGIWMIDDPLSMPDIIIYYAHGGGFSMGSAYFYFEFLMAWLSLLKSRGKWENPAIFALEYTLVPEATYPTQLGQTFKGYEYCVKRAGGDSSRVVVAGDSAGATLMLSLILGLEHSNDEKTPNGSNGTRSENEKLTSLGKPGFATMISPWCELVTRKNQNTASDYLNADSLHLYALEYLGRVVPVGDINAYQKGGFSIEDPIASPGSCTDLDLWKRACPQFGWHFIFGAEEVFAPATRDLIKKIRTAGGKVVTSDEPCQIHAWPVVALFLGQSEDERLAGLRGIVDAISGAMRKS